MPSVTASQFCTQYMDDRIKLSLFYSALNMVELAYCADPYFLPLQNVFVNIHILGRQLVAYVITKLRFQ